MTIREPLRVAHLIGSTGLYGAERWILAQMRYLDQRRIQATIINLVDVPGKRSDLVAEAVKRGHEAVDFYTGGRFNPLCVVRLAKLLRSERHAVLHSHGYKSDILGLVAGKMAGAKVVSTPHGWSKESDNKLMLYERIGRSSLKSMDHVCPLSRALYDDLIAVGVAASKVTLISNFVDVEEVDAIAMNPTTSGKKRIGFIGQFIDRKGIGDLIEAFLLLKRSDCELILIGDGPCRERILSLIESNNSQSKVHCLGYSSRRLEYLKSFDVFVLPSLEEGIPRCIMEAQAAKVPVIGTDIDGIRDLVFHEQTGLLVPPKNPPLLAQAIARMLNSPDLSDSVAVGGRKLIEERFSAQRTAQRYQTVYHSLFNLH